MMIKMTMKTMDFLTTNYNRMVFSPEIFNERKDNNMVQTMTTSAGDWSKYFSQTPVKAEPVTTQVWDRTIVGAPRAEGINAALLKKIIKKVEFYPPATKVTFINGEVVTVVAREGDEFNEEVGIMHCIMKYLFGTTYNTIIKGVIKDAEKAKADAKAAKEREKAEKKAVAVAKEEARKKEIARYQREREEKIEIQKEAYLRAMREMANKEVSCDRGTKE